MNDWDMWLHSSETRTLLKLFKKESEEILKKAGIKNFSIQWKWAFRYLIIVSKDKEL